jgi:hypothetical protein
MAKSSKPRTKINVKDIESLEELPKEVKIKKQTTYNSATEDFLKKHGLIKD